jgi:hypothetical protein
MTDHKSTLLKLSVLDAQHSTVESQHCVIHMTIVNYFQKCGFNFHQTDDGKDATDLTIAEDDWSQLNAGVTFQEYTYCNNDVMREGADLRSNDR